LLLQPRNLRGQYDYRSGSGFTYALSAEENRCSTRFTLGPSFSKFQRQVAPLQASRAAGTACRAGFGPAGNRLSALVEHTATVSKCGMG